MRQSPIVSLITLPWWLSLLVGLGMLAFGELLKISGGAGQAPGKVAFGQSIQFFSIIFLGFAAICFLISCFRDLPGADARQKPSAPPRPHSRNHPPPPKRKPTERDFMPAALRVNWPKRPRARPPLKLAPPRHRRKKTTALRRLSSAKTGTGGKYRKITGGRAKERNL